MKNIKTYFFLHLIVFMYSLSSICSKTAASKPFLSLEFIFFYGLVIAILGVYALLWQQILKKLPLNVAFANKSVTIIWGMIWGTILFKEKITLNMIIGAVVVLTGVIIVVTGGGESKNE